MGEVVDLKLASLVDDQELIVDLCRFRENLLTEKFIRRKHRLDNTTWERLGSDEETRWSKRSRKNRRAASVTAAQSENLHKNTLFADPIS